MRGVYSIILMTAGAYAVYGQYKAGIVLMVLTGLWMMWVAFWKIYNTPE